MPNQLPSGQWRARVRNPRTGKQINPATILGGPDTYPTRAQAVTAEGKARELLRSQARVGITVREWWDEWTTDPLWLRPAISTQLHMRERTAKFVDTYGDVPLRSISDQHVAAWLKGGRNLGTVPVLRTFFADAMTAQAGRLTERNPFAGLKLPSSRGRRDTQPPTQVEIARFLAAADELAPFSFASYLHTAVYEGMRPGELDALTWEQLDFQAGTIHVDRQWNVKARAFTPPKHGSVRTIAMTDPVRERLLTLPHESEFVFTTLRGSHYCPSTRSHHWNRVRASVGLGNVDLYTATRHYFGWYAWNVLDPPLDARDIALHFGHRDGGELVRKLYGHADAALARERVREAFREAPKMPTPMRMASSTVHASTRRFSTK
jgi:integrase